MFTKLDPLYTAYNESATEEICEASVLIEANFEQKDIDRIIGILSKSGGDMVKATKLAAQMSKLITDQSKANRRYEAALSILGKDHPVTKIFLDGLDNASPSTTQDLKKNTLGKLGSQSSRRNDGHDFKPRVMQGRRGYGRQMGSAILPLGAVNFTTGDSKMFNVLDTWGRERGTTAELWKDDNGKYKVIFTSGDGPIYKIGTRAFFNHDQNFNEIFNGTMVDWVNIGDLDLLLKYAKSAPGYVYK